MLTKHSPIGTIDEFTDEKIIVALAINNDDCITAYKSSVNELPRLRKYHQGLVNNESIYYETDIHLVSMFGKAINLNKAMQYFPKLKQKSYWKEHKLKGYGDKSTPELPSFQEK